MTQKKKVKTIWMILQRVLIPPFASLHCFCVIASGFSPSFTPVPPVHSDRELCFFFFHGSFAFDWKSQRAAMFGQLNRLKTNPSQAPLQAPAS